MGNQHRVVAQQPPPGIGFEHRADTDHAEPVQFGSAQCADACRTNDGDAPVQRVEDFLVPDRRCNSEHAVHQPDRSWRRLRVDGGPDVSGGGWRA